MAVHAGARAFDAAGDAYERGRPTYPAEVVDWMVAQLEITADSRVVDLAAGTGKLTRLLVERTSRLVAIEPLEGMWRKLRQTSPTVPVAAATAEQIPLRDGSVDAVTVAQAFHWFRAEEALAELHRVLRPGGMLGLAWNRRDESVPWVAGLGRLLDKYENDTPRFAKRLWEPAFGSDTPFTALESRLFHHDHEIDRLTLQDRVVSVSFVAALDDDEQASVLEATRALVADQPPRFAMPYVTEVLHCRRR